MNLLIGIIIATLGLIPIVLIHAAKEGYMPKKERKRIANTSPRYERHTMSEMKSLVRELDAQSSVNIVKFTESLKEQYRLKRLVSYHV